MAFKGDEANSRIGEGSIFEGRFYIHGSLRVDGRFDGEIKTEDQLFIGETGKMKTDVVANRVIVGGTLIGNIKAREEVVLLETGRVLGDITTPNLHLNKGVVIMGKIDITGGQKKEIKKIIEDSFTSAQAEQLPSKKGSIKKSKKMPKEQEVAE